MTMWLLLVLSHLPSLSALSPGTDTLRLKSGAADNLDTFFFLSINNTYNISINVYFNYNLIYR